MQDQSKDTEEFGTKELTLRLYSRYGMNDPTEHQHEPREIFGGTGLGHEAEGVTRSRLVFPDTAFIYCGSSAVRDESLDRLDLWRAYGVNGHGIAITTIWNIAGLAEDGLDFLKVEYVENAKLKELKDQSADLQSEIDKAIEERNLGHANELRRERMKLEVGYKGFDYKSEDEIRIVYYAGDKSSVVPPILHFTAETGRLQAYITRKIKVGTRRTLSGLYITIGPQVSHYEASHWKMMADWTIRQLGLSGIRSTRQSELIYIG